MQLTFGDAEDLGQRKQTRREMFLGQMDVVVPWKALLSLIEPHYPKAGRPGRQPYALETMLRIHFLQQWYALSDPAMEEALYDTPVMRRFAQLGGLDGIPDETTILNFRRLLETHDLAARMLGKVNAVLQGKGLSLRGGTIVDATIIAAPSSTKNADGKRDPQMHQTRKGNQWYFGMKAHIGVDDESGLVHHVECTAANVADVTQTHKLLHGREDTICGDTGYTGADKRPELRQARAGLLLSPSLAWAGELLTVSGSPSFVESYAGTIDSATGALSLTEAVTGTHCVGRYYRPRNVEPFGLLQCGGTKYSYAFPDGIIRAGRVVLGGLRDRPCVLLIGEPTAAVSPAADKTAAMQAPASK